MQNLTRFIPPINIEYSALNSQLRTLNSLLANSERPLILAGHGIRISKAADLFAKVIESLAIPCVFTWNASDLLPWDHPLYVGRPGVVAARAANFAVQNCDLLIAIGTRIDNVITGYNSKGFARAAKKVVVDIDENELRKHQFDPEIAIQASAKDFLSQWHKEPPPLDRRYPDWAEKCRDWKTRYPPGDEESFANKTNPVSHIHFVHALSDAISPGALIATGSSGLAIEFFYAAFKNKVSQRYFLTSGLGSMGYGLPAAIGACIGAGRRPTICVESDGSFMLNIQELATVKAYQLPISIIIMNNDGYASIRNTQKNYFASRFIGSNRSSMLQIPEIHKVAESFGVSSLASSDLEELRAFITAPSIDGPRLINFTIRADDSLSPKVSAMPQSDGTILSMPLEDMSPLLSIDELEAEMLVPLHPQSYAIRALN
jgi:acetolactate synthase-1/2/3 large subunit